MKNRDIYLKKVIRPKPIKEVKSVGDLVEKFGNASFQSRNIAAGVNIWKKMLEDNTVILLGLAGAMVPAGMRDVITHLIENRMIDCIVSTGANLFHDIHETLGKCHYQGSHGMDDEELYSAGIDRIYDVFAVEDEFRDTDRFIMDWASKKRVDKPVSTREFFYMLGERLVENQAVEGIVTAAYKNNIPIYCPAIGDSSIGISLALEKWRYKKNSIQFDVIKDVLETAIIVEQAKNTGVIYVGGGTPKNFIQQAEVTASIIKGSSAKGHKYAVQVIVDSPHWGGLSGCTFSEAKSWGKISLDSSDVTIYSDATIALPIMISAISDKYKSVVNNRKIPEFKMGDELEIIINNQTDKLNHE